MKELLVVSAVLLGLVVFSPGVIKAATFNNGYKTQVERDGGVQKLTVAEGVQFALYLTQEFKNEPLLMNVKVEDIREVLIYPFNLEGKKFSLATVRTDAGSVLMGFLSPDQTWLKMKLSDIRRLSFETAKEDVTDREDYAKAYVEKTLRKGDWVEFQVLSGNKLYKERYTFDGVEEDKAKWKVLTPHENGEKLEEKRETAFRSDNSLSIIGAEKAEVKDLWVDDVDQVKSLELAAVTLASLSDDGKEQKELLTVHVGALPWTYFKGLLVQKDKKEDKITREVVAVSRLLVPQKKEDKMDPKEAATLNPQLTAQLAALLKEIKERLTVDPEKIDDIFDLSLLTLKWNGRIYTKHVPTLEELKKKITDEVSAKYQETRKRLEELAQEDKTVVTKQKELKPKIEQAAVALNEVEKKAVQDEMELQRKLRDKAYNQLREQYIADCTPDPRAEKCRINPEKRMASWTPQQKQYFGLNREDTFLGSRRVQIGEQKSVVVKLSKTPQEEVVNRMVERVKEVPKAEGLKKDLSNTLKEHRADLVNIPQDIFNAATFTYPTKDYAIASFPGVSTKVKLRRQKDGNWKIATLEI